MYLVKQKNKVGLTDITYISLYIDYEKQLKHVLIVKLCPSNLKLFPNKHEVRRSHCSSSQS